MIPVVYAPVISPRVAEILDGAGVGRVDAAAVYEKLLAGPLHDAAKRWQEAGRAQL